MLNVGAIKEGFVLDHIKAGMSLSIYHDLKLDELDCCVAIIKNAKSNKMGKKRYPESRMQHRQLRPGYSWFYRSQHHSKHHQR